MWDERQVSGVAFWLRRLMRLQFRHAVWRRGGQSEMVLAGTGFAADWLANRACLPLADFVTMSVVISIHE